MYQEMAHGELMEAMHQPDHPGILQPPLQAASGHMAYAAPLTLSPLLMSGTPGAPTIVPARTISVLDAIDVDEEHRAQRSTAPICPGTLSRPLHARMHDASPDASAGTETTVLPEQEEAEGAAGQPDGAFFMEEVDKLTAYLDDRQVAAVHTRGRIVSDERLHGWFVLCDDTCCV
jgi:hypothetical protein